MSILPRSYPTHASSNGVPFVEQVLCSRRFTSICLAALNVDPVPRKSVLLLYRGGSERRLRQVKLFEQENRNSTKSPSSWWVRDAIPPHLSLFPTRGTGGGFRGEGNKSKERGALNQV